MKISVIPGCVSDFSSCWWNSLIDERNILVASVCGHSIMCLLFSLFELHLGHLVSSQFFLLCIWLPDAKKPLICFVTHMLCVVEYSFLALWMASQLRCVMNDGWTCSRLSMWCLRASPCM